MDAPYPSDVNGPPVPKNVGCYSVTEILLSWNMFEMYTFFRNVKRTKSNASKSWKVQR